MNVYDAIRLASLRAVSKPESDPQYALRRIFRWYSKTFVTPLDCVYDLPIEDVLQTYYESKYEEMDPDTLDRELLELVETDEEKQEREMAEDAENADMVVMAKTIQEEESKLAKVTSKLGQKLDELRIASDGSFIASTQNDKQKSSITHPFGSKDISTLPPDIKISFVDEDELGLDDDPLGLAPPKRKP